MNDALYSVLQRITTPTLARDNQLPQTRGQCRQRRGTTPGLASTSRLKAGRESLFQYPPRRQTANQGTKAASGGNLPQGWRQQSNQGKTATLPRTGNIYPNAGEYQSILRQNPILTNPRKESPPILNGIPDNKPPRRGMRGTAELTVYIRPLPMLPGAD